MLGPIPTVVRVLPFAEAAFEAPSAKSVSGFLNSGFVLLVAGFVLTTVGGAWITSRIQRATWERQTRVDLFRKRYEEGQAFLDDLAKAVGNRFFALQRFLWAIPDADQGRLEQIERDYFTQVVAWNATYWMNRNKIRLLIGDARANDFLDYRDDFRLEQPTSLHYHFVKAHRYVVKAKTGEVSTSQAQKIVDDLNWVCSELLEIFTTEFLARATSLQLLDAPRASSSLSAAMLEHSRQPRPPRTWGGSQKEGGAGRVD
jgi:hypothetical protein